MQKPQYGYPYDAHDGREKLDAPESALRTLRGGSWDGCDVAVRCAYRYWHNPRNRDFGVGFRVVSPGFEAVDLCLWPLVETLGLCSLWRGSGGAASPSRTAAGGRILRAKTTPMVTQVTATYADLYTWDNLYAAYRKAAKGKRGRVAAAAFEYRLEDNLIQLQDGSGRPRPTGPAPTPASPSTNPSAA